MPDESVPEHEEEANDEEDIHEAMPGEYDNNLFDEDDDEDLLFKHNTEEQSDIMTSRWQDAVQARKACRTGQTTETSLNYVSKPPRWRICVRRCNLRCTRNLHQQQKRSLLNQDMHFAQTRPPPRFDKTLGIGTFMGSPSSPSSMKTGARGGDDAEGFTSIPEMVPIPKIRRCSKHQQGREAVLDDVQAEKERLNERASYYQRSIASPTKITSGLTKGEFFAFHEHFRPEVSSDTVGFGRKNKKKNRERKGDRRQRYGGFRISLERKEVKDIDDGFRYRRTTTIVRCEGEAKIENLLVF